MLHDRLDWKEPVEKPPRRKGSVINVTMDLTPEKPGAGRTPFEEALRTIFPGGYTRKDACWFARQAIKAVSKAVIQDGRAEFPLEAVMVPGCPRAPKMAAQCYQGHPQWVERQAKTSGETVESINAKFNESLARALYRNTDRDLIQVNFGRRVRPSA